MVSSFIFPEKLNRKKHVKRLTLNVIVEDVNDHAPSFESTEYILNIEENVEIGTSVASIFAEDEDDIANSDVTYSVIGTEYFSIDAKNGKIKTKLELCKKKPVIPKI